MLEVFRYHCTGVQCTAERGDSPSCCWRSWPCRWVRRGCPGWPSRCWSQTGQTRAVWSLRVSSPPGETVKSKLGRWDSHLVRWLVGGGGGGRVVNILDLKSATANRRDDWNWMELRERERDMSYHSLGWRLFKFTEFWMWELNFPIFNKSKHLSEI